MKPTRVVAIACLLGAVGSACAGDVDKEVPPLFRKIRDRLSGSTPAERLEGIRAVVEVNSEMVTTQVRLAGLLRGHEERVRLEAARALFDLGPSARLSVSDVLAALDEEDSPRVRQWLIRALGSMAPFPAFAPNVTRQVLSHLLQALQDKDEGVRIAAIGAIGCLGPGACSAVPQLVRALKEPEVRKAESQLSVPDVAAYALGSIGPAAHEAIPALLDRLKTGDPRLQYDIFRALGLTGPGDPKVVHALVSILQQDKDPSMRSGAGYALGLMGPSGKDGVPAMVQALKAIPAGRHEWHRRLRHGLVSSLGEIGPGAKEAVPTLVEILKNEELDDPVRRRAAQSLGRMGAAAGKALPDLIGFVWNPGDSFSVYEGVEEALAGIGPTAVSGLLDALKANNAGVRRRALSVLARMGPRAEEALPQVEQATHDADQLAAQEAARARARITRTKVQFDTRP